MPDYMFLLESRLSPEQRAAMLRVQELAAAMGFNVYLTGGTVRDLITGATLRDLDFTIEGNPSKMAREMEKGGAKIVSEDEKLRHVEMFFAGEVEGSLSAARDEYYVRPGTRPEIRWSTIMEDLRRRDFSLNAIAISLNPASRGLLLGSHQRPIGHRARRSSRADHSQFHQPARAPAACLAHGRAHGFQTGIAYARMVQLSHRTRVAKDHHARRCWPRIARSCQGRAASIGAERMGRAGFPGTGSSAAGQETPRLRGHFPFA